MDAILVIGRLILAAVFVVAAVAKVVDRPGARRALEQFGVPSVAVPAVALALPLVEIAVAVALVPEATAQAGAIAATGLLAAFTAAVGLALARGTEAECHCFGAVSARPVGAGTLARNVALLALAVLVAAGGAGTSATGWISGLSTTEAVLAAVSAVLAVVVAVHSVFLFQLFRQNGRLVAQLSSQSAIAPAEPAGLQVGEFAPAFELPDLSGNVVELNELLEEERGLMLLFTSPECAACDPLLPAVGRRQRQPGAGPAVVPINLGDADGVAAKAAEHGIGRVLLIEDFELPHALGVSGFPGAVVLDRDGRVAEEVVLGTTAVGELIGHQDAPPDLVHVGGSG